MTWFIVVHNKHVREKKEGKEEGDKEGEREQLKEEAGWKRRKKMYLYELVGSITRKHTICKYRVIMHLRRNII